MARLARLEVFTVPVPVTGTFRFASGTAGRAGDSAPVVLVKATDDDGVSGWGEGRPMPSWSYETAASVSSALRDHLGPAVVGVQADDRWGLHDRMRRAVGLGPTTGMPVAKAALDVALADLAARASGRTLRAFLGGADSRRRVELSWTVTAHDPVEAGEVATEAREAGFRHVNYKVGVEPATDVAVAGALRSATGPDGVVWADANQGLGLGAARLLAERLRDVGCDLLEQPLRADLAHQMRALRQATTLPLAVDESSVSPSDLLPLAAEGVVDHLVVKVTRSGGLWPTLQQLAVAEAAGLGVLVSGLTDCLLTKVAACQVATVVGCTGPAGLNGSQFLDESRLFPAKGDIEGGGTVTLPDTPGLGVAPDEDAVRATATETSLVRPD